MSIKIWECHVSPSNLGFNADVSMHKLFYVGYQHILFMFICSLGCRGRASGSQRSKSIPQFLLLFSPKGTPTRAVADTKKQRGESLWEQRPEQVFSTGIRNSFPSLFRVPNPKRWLYSWVHTVSLIHLWETLIRLEQETDHPVSGQALWAPLLLCIHDTYKWTIFIWGHHFQQHFLHSQLFACIGKYW